MRLILLSASLLALAAASPARAGQSYDNCSGFIDSVPATITTQGVWCLRADLSTAITSGTAITVSANNVTVDCNYFKLGGLGGGTGSNAVGILSARINTTVRNCNVRGFYRGINIVSSGGNLVESNRLDGNTFQGISVVGDGSVVRDNQVYDTGGSTQNPTVSIGIATGGSVDIVGNLVFGVSAIGGNPIVYGVFTQTNTAGSIRENRIKGVIASGAGSARGIWNDASGRVAVRDNDILGTGAASSVGLRCTNNLGASGSNFISGFTAAVQGCTSVGNVINDN